MGESGDIFFPKLNEEKDMIPYDRIAIDLLHELGYEPDFCESEEEAKQKTLVLIPGSKKYPIYLFKSDTSGEKANDEFYTENEILDTDSYNNLGVIKNAKKRKISEINELFANLQNLFKKTNITKAEIVETLKTYLPNFGHIETGRGLDAKM